VSPDKSDPFPEDGKFPNDKGLKEEFEYSYVEVENGSVEESFSHSGRARPSTSSRAGSVPEGPSEKDALDGRFLTEKIPGDPMDAEEPATAEDPATWREYLCGADVVQNAANYAVFVSYYRRQFGSERRGGVLGKGPEEKTQTEDTLSRVFTAMRTMMRQPSVSENPASSVTSPLSTLNAMRPTGRESALWTQCAASTASTRSGRVGKERPGQRQNNGLKPKGPFSTQILRLGPNVSERAAETAAETEEEEEAAATKEVEEAAAPRRTTATTRRTTRENHQPTKRSHT